MSIFTAAVELLGLIGESSELAKLGSQSAIFNVIENELSAAIASGLSLNQARERVRNKYQSPPAPNVVNPRNPSVESENEDFISRINRNVRDNTLRQRRPLTDFGPFEDVPLLQRQRRPLTENIPLNQPIRLPRPIRNPSAIARGALIAGAAGATAAQIGNLPGNQTRVPPSTPTPAPSPAPTPVEQPTETPITTPIETIKITHPAIAGIPKDISNNLLDPMENDDLIYNLHVHGGYKFPLYHWHDDSTLDYMYQSLYNTFSGDAPLY